MSSLLPRGGLQLGLGCSRLGSVNGTTGNEARSLLNAALDEGFRFFDTSNVYAQGDSERYLGEIIGNRDDCVICSKGGKYLPLVKRALVPAKNLLRGLTRLSPGARQGVAKARERPLPTRWDTAFLARAIDDSLRRLKRDRIDVYLLHSPPAETLRRWEAVDALERAMGAGKVGRIGASVDDVAAAHAALDDRRITVLQVPLRQGDAAYAAVLARAATQNVSIVAREILGGQAAIAGTVDPASFAETRISELIRNPLIALPLVGTTKLMHLRSAVQFACKAMQTDKE